MKKFLNVKKEQTEFLKKAYGLIFSLTENFISVRKTEMFWNVKKSVQNVFQKVLKVPEKKLKMAAEVKFCF